MKFSRYWDVVLPLNALRNFFNRPLVFVIFVFLLTGGLFTWYQKQPHHAPGEPAPQMLREDLEDGIRIIGITVIFFGVFNLLSSSQAVLNKNSIDAVEKFREKYVEYRTAKDQLGISEKISHSDIKKNKEAKKAVYAILASCETLSVQIKCGLVNKDIAKETLIGAFVVIGDELFSYIEEKQQEHPGRWINFLEVYLLWTGEIDEIDNKARIRKGNFSERLEHVKIKLMSEIMNSETPETSLMVQETFLSLTMDSLEDKNSG